jgi:hypothetical protein
MARKGGKLSESQPLIDPIVNRLRSHASSLPDGLK